MTKAINIYQNVSHSRTIYSCNQLVAMAEKLLTAAEGDNTPKTNHLTNKISKQMVHPVSCNDAQHSRCLQIVDVLEDKQIALQRQIDALFEYLYSKGHITTTTTILTTQTTPKISITTFTTTTTTTTTTTKTTTKTTGVTKYMCRSKTKEVLAVLG